MRMNENGFKYLKDEMIADLHDRENILLIEIAHQLKRIANNLKKWKKMQLNDKIIQEFKEVFLDE